MGKAQEEKTVDVKDLKKNPQYTICQFCHARALTRLEHYMPSGEINGLMLFFICCMPISIYRLFFTKDIAYHCGSCDKIIAKRGRVDGTITVYEADTEPEIQDTVPPVQDDMVQNKD